MAFYHARNFQVGTVNATEIQNQNNYGGTSEVLDRLISAACIAAGHRSAERSDPPKCHPETRQAVISNIMSWVNSSNPKEPITWLNGPAGAGKSAIAQTVADACEKEGKLISSFFFSRTSTSGGRDDGARLIPTIACHLAIAIPEVKDAIIAVFNRNPAILSYSMEDQMKDLVLDPLVDVIARIPATGDSVPPIPHLVIIDGLDECNKPLDQSRIIKVIAGVVAEPSIHLRFLIASRPEQAIRKTFESLKDIYVRLTLDESYHPDKDIEVYLRSEFSRIKRTHTLALDLSVESNWPSQQDIEQLVEKSSGQFIYASTIIKFVDNDRKDPRDQLRTILNMSPGKRSNGSPFAPLDALYTFILSTAVAEADGYDTIECIFQALLYSEMDHKLPPDPGSYARFQDIAIFFGISCTVLQLSLVDLHSIMFIPSSDSSNAAIRFFHASFGDFLKDCSRSSAFFVEEVKAHIALGNRCLDIVLGHKTKANDCNMSNVLYRARRNYFMHMERSNFHEDILSKLRGCNVRSVIPEMFSGLSDKEINFILCIFCDLNYDGQYISEEQIVPLSKKHGDIINDISPGIDAFILKKYSSHDTSHNTKVLMNDRSYNPFISRNGPYGGWLASLMNSPTRGQHLFMSEEKCEYLVHVIFQAWARNKPLFGLDILGDMFVLKYSLKRIKPSSSFRMFLRGELPNLVASLRVFADRGSYPASQQLVDLVSPFIKGYDPLIHCELEKSNSQCKIKFHRELEKSSFRSKIKSGIKKLLCSST